MASLPVVNALADGAPSFVWRLQTEYGDATGLRVFDDPLVIINVSVWESVEALRAFVYDGAHRDVMAHRQKWMARLRDAGVAAWWVSGGHRPSAEEGRERLEHLRNNGNTPFAFSIRDPFPPPQAV